MPDTIVEFINVTGRTYDQLVAGVTIASTSSTEQAVVKDVVLTNPNNRNLRLMVEGAVVAEVEAPGRLTGSELLGASESLVLRTASLAVVNRIQAFPDQSTFTNNTIPTQFGSIGQATVVGAGPTTVNFASTLTTDPYFAVIAQNGDFYYSNNNTSALFRRAGGVNGTQTQITANGRSCSFDGRYIYSFGQGNKSMSVTDTQSNGSVLTADYTGTTWNVGSSGNSAAIDGYVWLKPDWNTPTGLLINGATRAAVEIGGVSDGTQQRFFVGIGKNSSGDYIAVQLTSYNTQSAYWWNLGSSLASPAIKASGAVSVSSAGNVSNTNSNNMHRTPGSDRFLLHIPGGGQNNTSFDLDTIQSNTARFFSFSNITVAQTSGRVLSVNAASANNDFGLINVRATGIKITP